MTIDKFNKEYHFLSNFFPVEIKFLDAVYPSVEHAYQAAKCINSDDRKFFLVGSAAEAKKRGRTVSTSRGWDYDKFSIMRSLLRKKFRDPVLRNWLMSTYPHELVEGNNWGDMYWGVYKGVGENNLGKLLMQIRNECPVCQEKLQFTPLTPPDSGVAFGCTNCSYPKEQ